MGPEAGVTPIEVHKALADDTRFRLYRYLRLSGRPVSIRELSTRLSLHPNTLRPHLRRLEDVGLVARESRRGATVGRPQVLYSVVERDSGHDRDYRLLAEILASLVRGGRARDRAERLARDWGAYLVRRDAPKPGSRSPAGRNLAVLQDAMARAGFDPRFRRTDGGTVEISMRECPFRDLLDEHRELVCSVHHGLLDGMIGEVRPGLEMTEFAPARDRSPCRVRVSGAGPAAPRGRRAPGTGEQPPV
jgi:predicted ArsR family transcriptional regulator